MVVLRKQQPGLEQAVALYDAVGWRTYTKDPAALVHGLRNSGWLVCAMEDDKLVGLCRAMTDGFSICYLQDVLVHPSHQGQGLGKRLVQACLDDHQHVRQVVLMTDDRPEQLGLYSSVGLRRLSDLTKHKLNVFLRIKGVDLA